jgi:hypothetical protein
MLVKLTDRSVADTRPNPDAERDVLQYPESDF